MAKVFRDYAEVNEKLLEGFTVAEVLTGINAEGSGMMLELERTIDNGNSSAFRLHCYGIRPFKVCHTAKGRIPLQPLRILTDFAAGAKSWAELLQMIFFRKTSGST